MSASRLRAAAFGLLAAAALVAAVEVACRRYVSRREPDVVSYPELLTMHAPSLAWGLRPGVAVSLGGYAETAVIRTNAQGFRYPRDLASPKPPGTLRIFVLGGSAAFGLGVSDSETLAARIEERLAARLGGAVEVVTAAVPGYTAREELQMLAMRVLPMEPDAVLILDGHNDMCAAMNGENEISPFGIESTMVRDLRRREAVAERSLAAYALREAVGRSGIVRALARKWRKLHPAPAMRLREPPAEALSSYERTLRAAVGAARGAGVDALLIAQPCLPFGRTPSVSERASLEAAERQVPGLTAAMATNVQAYAGASSRAAAAAGGRFIDLTGAFRDETAACYMDLVHLTPPAAEILADRIVESGLAAPKPVGTSGPGASS